MAQIDNTIIDDLMELSVQMLKISRRMHNSPVFKDNEETLKYAAITMLTIAAGYTEEPNQP
jgi:hypothetical protein